MDPDEEKKKLEQNILSTIEEKLTKGQLTAERSQEIAKLVLDSLHPHLNLEQIFQIAKNIEEHFPELKFAVLSTMEDRDKEMRTIVALNAQKLIQAGNVDEADYLLKDTLQKI